MTKPTAKEFEAKLDELWHTVHAAGRLSKQAEVAAHVYADTKKLDDRRDEMLDFGHERKTELMRMFRRALEAK